MAIDGSSDEPSDHIKEEDEISNTEREDRGGDTNTLFGDDVVTEEFIFPRRAIKTSFHNTEKESPGGVSF